MSEAYTIEIEETPDDKDVTLVQEGLQQYNLHYADQDNYKGLAVFLRNEANSVVGGLLGCTYWGYLNIQVLWVMEDHRHVGGGQALLNTAEQEAIKRGCTYAHLDTHDFQALSFYQKRGFAIVGELEELPPGHSRYLLRKVL